jgi:hypothetical protein
MSRFVSEAGSGDGDGSLRDLRLSLAALAAVVVCALIGLSLDGNWPKVLRVSLSFAAYAAVLVGAVVWSCAPRQRAATGAPLRWFLAAGAAAGGISGLLQPVFDVDVLIVGASGAAVLFGTMHWLALRYWRVFLKIALQRAEGGSLASEDPQRRYGCDGGPAGLQ